MLRFVGEGEIQSRRQNLRPASEQVSGFMPFDQRNEQDLFAGARFLVVDDSHAADVVKFVQTFGGVVDPPGDSSRPQGPFRWRWDREIQDVGNAILTAEVEGLVLLSRWGVSRFVEVWGRSLGIDRARTMLADLDWVVGDEFALARLRRLHWELPSRSICLARTSHDGSDGRLEEAETPLEPAASMMEEPMEVAPADLSRQILQALDRYGRLECNRLAAEVTTCFSSLCAGLESRGARVRPFPLSGSPDAYHFTAFRSGGSSDASDLRFVLIHDDEGISWLLEFMERTGRTRQDFHLIVAMPSELAGDCIRLGFHVVARCDHGAISDTSVGFARRLATRLW